MRHRVLSVSTDCNCSATPIWRSSGHGFPGCSCVEAMHDRIKEINRRPHSITGVSGPGFMFLESRAGCGSDPRGVLQRELQKRRRE
jgi:hypothetical protein